MSNKKRKHIPESLKLKVLLRDSYKCVVCYSDKELHVDHIIPRSRGGSDTEENLQVLCRICNAIKQSYLLTVDDLRECLKIHQELLERDRQRYGNPHYRPIIIGNRSEQERELLLESMQRYHSIDHIHAQCIIMKYCKSRDISLLDL